MSGHAKKMVAGSGVRMNADRKQDGVLLRAAAGDDYLHFQ